MKQCNHTAFLQQAAQFNKKAVHRQYRLVILTTKSRSASKPCIQSSWCVLQSPLSSADIPLCYHPCEPSEAIHGSSYATCLCN
ncbi:hypothetical protein PR048_013350 [Dryococelus australis]|uniref:Uncharacterized protein n=1 Tax=Dryococelus australis TaxID=614101 RepID=A0ABQ9HS81_9NEOP|nr:hypothetical protein PR048_013350 [Dryococelus australis]